ncbi:hypothetical protein SY83_17575 [Paenibacillus swuensis]|uniref:VWFA domain-containing protein n=1 Tax=Paenibacillus swuensis TaxID=1178515 RepID=A0A172TL61_9BACL|nr:hypothetical protein [Paenibacillus swuensis]ANE47795.1 hypothetical protein SY83_17575 [Paenibacillus swuensis]
MTFVKLAPSEVDSFLQMELTDLSRTLSREKELDLDWDLFASWQPYGGENGCPRLLLSRFWKGYENSKERIGLKSDVYLYALGASKYSNLAMLQQYISSTQGDRKREPERFPSIRNQLLLFFEERRLAQVIMTERQGTAIVFRERYRMLESYYENKAKQHLRQRQHTDALFACIVVQAVKEGEFATIATATDAELPETIRALLWGLRHEWARLSEATSTAALIQLSDDLFNVIKELLTEDMRTVYYAFNPGPLHDNRLKTAEDSPEHPDPELTRLLDSNLPEERSKPLQTPDTSADPNSAEGAPERLPTWHRETAPASSLLRFELERGTRSHTDGTAARSLEEGDQALAVVRARELPARTRRGAGDPAVAAPPAQSPEPPQQGRAAGVPGINRFARAVRIGPGPTTPAQAEAYRRMAQAVAPLRRKLHRTILLTMERQRTAPRTDLAFGRMGRNLTRAATEPLPRLFYKKARPASRLDTAFMLLVDGSASMADKMEETKLGITLFHETLKSLSIPHAVIAHWEDAEKLRDEDYPNIFQEVLSFDNAMLSSKGPEIMQLEPEQDNRDGFAIRTVIKDLLRRTEQQRILMVFSDGEPSAEQYHEEGILDTYSAVHEARRQGIEVIGVFLASREIKEQERRTMENIYGKGSVLIPRVEELPSRLIPILRKLLLRHL